MKKSQFIEKIEKYYKTLNLPIYKGAPVVHKGFPGNFNLSLSEYEFLRQNKDFMNLKHDICYVVTQNAIRHSDFTYISKPSDDSYRYLLWFTLAPVAGVYWEINKSFRQKRAQMVIESTINFLVQECGFDINKIHIQYLKSAKISEITSGKYMLDKVIPTDPYLDIYRNLGIPEKNFIPVQNRDALLALNVYGRTTPWGYRNEIFYEYKGKLLDIGTVENLVFKPIYEDNNNLDETKLLDLVDYEHTLALGGIGVERVLMVINKLNSVNELDIIAKPVKSIVKYLSEKEAIKLVQTLRAVCLILADGGKYDDLQKRRKQRLRDFMNLVWQILHDNKISHSIFCKLIETIADQEKLNPQIKKSIEHIKREFLIWDLRKKYGQHWTKHISEIGVV